MVWTNPDFDGEEMEKEMEENARRKEEEPSWMEFIVDLRNHRYGELPEDYDGLADDEEEE